VEAGLGFSGFPIGGGVGNKCMVLTCSAIAGIVVLLREIALICDILKFVIVNIGKYRLTVSSIFS